MRHDALNQDSLALCSSRWMDCRSPSGLEVDVLVEVAGTPSSLRVLNSDLKIQRQIKLNVLVLNSNNIKN